MAEVIPHEAKVQQIDYAVAVEICVGIKARLAHECSVSLPDRQHVVCSYLLITVRIPCELVELEAQVLVCTGVADPVTVDVERIPRLVCDVLG